MNKGKIGIITTLIAGIFGFPVFTMYSHFYENISYDLEKIDNLNPKRIKVHFYKDEMFASLDWALSTEKVFVKLNEQHLNVQSDFLNDSTFILDLTEDDRFNKRVSRSANTIRFSFRRADKYFSEGIVVNFASQEIRNDNKSDEQVENESLDSNAIFTSLSANATVKIYRDHQLDRIVKGHEFKAMLDDSNFTVIHHLRQSGKVVELTVNEE